MLVVKEVKYTRDKQNFHYDFRLEKNEWLSVLGPSGSGKTTMLELVAGFLTPEEGDIFLEGQALISLPPGCRNLSYIFQNHGVFEHLSVQKNLDLCFHDRKISSAEKKNLILKMLENVKLQDYFLERYPSQLSGGEKSRLQIARAMLRPCKLLLMDEPFSALDQPLRQELLKLVHHLQTEQKLIVVFVTHDEGDAHFNSSEILKIQNGRGILLRS